MHLIILTHISIKPTLEMSCGMKTHVHIYISVHTCTQTFIYIYIYNIYISICMQSSCLMIGETTICSGAMETAMMVSPTAMSGTTRSKYKYMRILCRCEYRFMRVCMHSCVCLRITRVRPWFDRSTPPRTCMHVYMNDTHTWIRPLTVLCVCASQQ